MDYAVRVGVLERLADLVGDAERLLQGKPMALGPLDEPFDIAAAHELGHEIGLAALLTDVVNGDDVLVVAQLTHRLGLTANPGLPLRIEAIGLDERERHIPVELGVVREEDAFLTALPEETNDPIAAVAERCRVPTRIRPARIRSEAAICVFGY